MKKGLIIKMSSMGDIIHTLPALTDAKKALGDIQFDWVVEPGFAEIPKWHTAVNQVICAPFRQWRKTPFETIKSGGGREFIHQLRSSSYDIVIDAQGLVKSALVCLMSKGPKCGLDKESARESIASYAYQHKFFVAKNQHAVERVRQLFAKALSYVLPLTSPDYGINRSLFNSHAYGEKSILFLHGTTWITKHWPERYWQKLGALVSQAGYQVLLPWGNEREKARAQEITTFSRQQGLVEPIILPKLSLGALTALIASAKGVVAVDTGLGHIAAAMAVPTVSLYGPTDPGLTGAYGPNQLHLRSNFPCSPCMGKECKKGNHFEITPPCFEPLSPESVWQTLVKLMQP